MIFFTSICANYLPKAMALAESVKRAHPDAVFVLCLVERQVPPEAKAFPHFDEIVLARHAGWDNFDQFIFRHAIVEAAAAVKARFFRHLLANFDWERKFVYLDPDVIVYSPLVELEALLDTHSIVLCPHLLRPGNLDMELSSLAHGAYNLGFLAVSRHGNAERFLEWWDQRLFHYCRDDKINGVFTDQKWIDLVPSFFDAHILKHHGYDFATWSLLGCVLEEGEDGYAVNRDPLRFLHFSGVDSGVIDRMSAQWLNPASAPLFARLLTTYRADLARHGQATAANVEWTYARYDDGSPIGRQARVAYRDPALWTQFPEPFACSDAELAPAADGPVAWRGLASTVRRGMSALLSRGPGAH